MPVTGRDRVHTVLVISELPGLAAPRRPDRSRAPGSPGAIATAVATSTVRMIERHADMPEVPLAPGGPRHHS
ncbi:hypothetical protein [Actinomycetospora sp. NBRC 106375]|uniref:hypothetical protein n=1 Tax=Actinomycetospora sp. NBRC 106375 TaxID=3032207 RepID=UPI0025569563|nr:hypothetical protein [Actinomycetospora sp. NBRC 106375]